MSNVARVESPVTHQNAQDAFDLLMEVKVVGQLLKGLAEDSPPIEIHRLNDLGNLILRLADQPSGVVAELLNSTNGESS